MRKMANFVHFYFGDAEETFYTGVGTVLRALGHEKRVRIILTDTKFNWVEKISKETNSLKILKVKSREDVNLVKKSLNPFNEEIVLISDIDLIIKKRWLTIEELKDIILQLKEKNEIIITSMSFYKTLADIADYCSEFQKREKKQS